MNTNRPCDNHGMAACSSDCPQYGYCMGWTEKLPEQATQPPQRHTRFDEKRCEHCGHFHMQCAGFTTSAARFVCPACGIVHDEPCGDCETCYYWPDCEMREEPQGKPRITANATRSEWFGDFLNYTVTWGAFVYRSHKLKNAVQAAHDIAKGITL